MKEFTKFAIACIIGIVSLGFYSCGSDDEEEEVKISVTKSEIQGGWHNTSYGMYRHIVFEGDNYTYIMMEVDSGDIEHRENGTYSLSGMEITFNPTKGNTVLGGEIYWEDESKNWLHIYPAGTFLRVD